MNRFTSISKILALLLVAAVTISVIAVPADVSAVSKKKHKKPKVTCSISFKNIDGNTVIKKGKKLKVKYSAKSSNGKKVKVRFRSSNRRIATVSRNGVIKAKRNGTVKITATGYVKGRKRGRKTVKIKVGKPVTGIRLSGYTYLRAGRSTKLKSDITPSNATNKKIVWSSSDTRAVKVDQSGNIKGVGNGRAVITARAADGSGASRNITVYSHRYTRNDTHWIAHRGLHEKATENTAEAFRLAGQAGFWGCECDIWETKHVVPESQSLPEYTENDISNTLQPDTEPVEVVDDEEVLAIEKEIETIPDDINAILDIKDSVAEVQSKYNMLRDDQKSQVRLELGDETLLNLFHATSIINEYDSFDLAICHDGSYKRTFGVNKYVWDLTTKETKERVKGVCFLTEYLEICKKYNMIPIIEIKNTNGHYFSDIGIRKIVDEVVAVGGSEWLGTVHYISFDYDTLIKIQNEYERRGCLPQVNIEYLIGSNPDKKVEMAKEAEFNGVCIYLYLYTPAISKKCESQGLLVGTWTYDDTENHYGYLYKHLLSKEYKTFMATTNGKFFK